MSDHGSVREDRIDWAHVGTDVTVVYVGAATATVFLFRYMSQRSLSPMTVGVYHNLIPVLTIALACLCFGEELEGSTIVGGFCIIAGAELVRRRASSIGWLTGDDWQIAKDLFTLSPGYRTSQRS